MVTSQRNQVQKLIADIDSVLQRSNSRLPWVMAGEVAQQRQVLEKVRNYLVSLEQSLGTNSGSESIGFGTELLAHEFYQPAQGQPPQPRNLFSREGQIDLTTQQMMQTLLQEVSYLRANLAQPAQPQPITAELLQVLMSRLQESLSQQITQTLSSLQNQSFAYNNSPMLAPSSSAITPGTLQYEQLQALRQRSDQMMMNLDASINVVFDSLQRNIETYQESLAQGLDRMHGLGQQGEVAFKALLDQLAQQLKQEASSYLLSSTPSALEAVDSPASTQSLQSAPSPPPVDASVDSAPAFSVAPSPRTDQGVSVPPAIAFNYPYAGSEVLSSEWSAADVTTPADRETAALEAALSEALQIEWPTSELLPAPPPAIADDAWLKFAAVDLQPEATAVAPAIAASQPELNFPDLDLSTLELAELDSETGEFRFNPPLSLPENTAPLASGAALAGIDSPPVDAAAIAPDEDTAQFDAALQLLEELSAELDNSSVLSLEEAEAQLDLMLGSVQMPAASMGLASGLSDDARVEVDEFYQSLFGGEPANSDSATDQLLVSPDSTASPIAPEPESTDSANSLTELAQDLFATAAPAIAPVVDQPGPLDLDAIPFLSDLFSSVTAEEARSMPAAPPTSTTTNLLGDRSSNSTDNSPFSLRRPDEMAYGLDGGDDQYTRASNEENLLPNASTIELAIELELDDLTLSSLNEDLSNLEQRNLDIETADVDFSWTDTPSETALSQRDDHYRDGQLRDATPREEILQEDGLPGETRGSDLNHPNQLEAEAETNFLDAQSSFTLDDFASELTQPDPVAPAQANFQAESQTVENLLSETAAIEDQRSLSLEDFSASFDPENETGVFAPELLAHPSANPAIADDADLTVESFSALFGSEATSPATTVEPRASNFFEEQAPTSDLALDPTFTLEGRNDLFGDALEAHPVSSISVTAAADPASPFTLEGMDDLFGEAQTLLPLDLAGLETTQAPSQPDPVPPMSQPSPPTQSAALSSQAEVKQPTRAIPTFKPETYIKGPSETSGPGTTASEPPSFKLERLDSLFDETANPTINSTFAPPEPNTPAMNPAAADQRSLDAAYQSLLGMTPGLEAPPTPGAEPDSSQASKKKRPPPKGFDSRTSDKS